jgi:HAD superfamily hydrolase (TIGR01509 family)
MNLPSAAPLRDAARCNKPIVPRPKAVVFDLGKVLLDFDFSIAATKIAVRGKMPPREIMRHFSTTPLLRRYESGLVSDHEFYREMCQATGFAGDAAEFGVCFGDMFAPIEPMIALQSDLRKHGVPTFVFSNTNGLAIQSIRRAYPFFGEFDGYILSYQHGAMKPDPKLYEVVELETGRRGAELLYIDDRADNIETGRQRGWQVILQESPEQTMAAVKALGLLNSRP